MSARANPMPKASRRQAVILLGIDPATGEHQCLWLHSHGAAAGCSPTAFGRVKRGGDSITFLFRDADGTISFSNTFSYDTDAQAWTVAGRQRPQGRHSRAFRPGSPHPPVVCRCHEVKNEFGLQTAYTGNRRHGPGGADLRTVRRT